ncbi:hypothetical protein D3C83_51900 [compost metagenome]
MITDQPRERRALEDPVSAITGFGDAIPFSDGTFRAAALGTAIPGAAADAATPGAGLSLARANDAVRCTALGGRVVGASVTPLPEGTRDLARDEKEWVAEVDARATVVELKRRS